MSELASELPAEVVRLLDARAVRLAAPPKSLEADEDQTWFATVPVGDLDVAIALDRLRAAIPLRRVSPVPLAPPEVVGIMRWSGTVLTVFSLAFLLGGQASRNDSSYLIVVERASGRLVAFDCAQIPLAMTRPTREIELARARSSGPLLDVPRPERVLTVIDVDKLLTSWESRRGA
ncbi:MAG: chemotaxis protein CheW [Polyangiaceae bacterium]